MRKQPLLILGAKNSSPQGSDASSLMLSSGCKLAHPARPGHELFWQQLVLPQPLQLPQPLPGAVSQT